MPFGSQRRVDVAVGFFVMPVLTLQPIRAALLDGILVAIRVASAKGRALRVRVARAGRSDPVVLASRTALLVVGVLALTRAFPLDLGPDASAMGMGLLERGSGVHELNHRALGRHLTLRLRGVGLADLGDSMKESVDVVLIGVDVSKVGLGQATTQELRLARTTDPGVNDQEPSLEQRDEPGLFAADRQMMVVWVNLRVVALIAGGFLTFGGFLRAVRLGRASAMPFTTPTDRLGWMRRRAAIKTLGVVSEGGRALTYYRARLTPGGRPQRPATGERGANTVRERAVIADKSSAKVVDLDSAQTPGASRRGLVARPRLPSTAHAHMAPLPAPTKARAALTALTEEPLHPVAVEENPTLGRSLWSNEAGNVQVIIGGFEYRSDAGKHNPAPYGYRFVVFGMGIANGTSHSIHVNPLNVTLVDQTGLTYACHAASQSWCTMPLGPVDVGPGDHAEGSLVFLIALSSWPARIIYRTSAIGTDVVVNVEREPTA